MFHEGFFLFPEIVDSYRRKFNVHEVSNPRIENVFSIQNKAFDSTTESFASDGVGRFVTRFVLHLKKIPSLVKHSVTKSKACVSYPGIRYLLHLLKNHYDGVR